ncbi:MAG: SDR family oxidoreductase, partial [Spirochaetales bacterium]|nr:SDR family oxidoreductase [Spirochaetales bacterium]
SGGIGRAVTYSLASQGASVICHGGNDPARLDRIVDYVRGQGGKARGLFVPIDRAADILAHLNDVGEPDIVVVALGPIVYASLEHTSEEQWTRMVDLNLLLPGLLLSRYLPAMVKRGWGRVVLFGGPYADQARGFTQIAAYSAAKAGLVSLCKSAARQTKGQNVSVNLIAPGFVDTEYLSAEERAYGERRSPRGAMIPPERIARVVNHLILAEEPDMNGAIIAIDQGMG